MNYNSRFEMLIVIICEIQSIASVLSVKKGNNPSLGDKNKTRSLLVVCIVKGMVL